MLELENIFSADGPLSNKISGYNPRPAQLQMAQAIARAIKNGQHLIAEAGTGTGKTLAYLIPAILSGNRVIVSTGTKNLQDQLFNKDLPAIRSVLSVPFQAALLKGRSNYLCRYRLNNVMESESGFSKLDAVSINRINRWAGKTRVGDISEVSSVDESASVWPMVTSTGDNCLGQECPEYNDCFLVKSRRRAQEAEILVVNHHLLCADWSIRDDGFGELLPEADVIIVDEAHQFYDVASRFLGASVSARQINDLSKDVVVEFAKDAPDMPDLKDRADALLASVKEARLLFGESVRRGAWQEIERDKNIVAGVEEIITRLSSLIEVLDSAAQRGKGLESCLRRCKEIIGNLSALLKDNQGEWIRWYETHKRTFSLNRTPFEIAEEFQKLVEVRGSTWIYTSATLTVANRFDHFKWTLGLDSVNEKLWDSPFDYPKQALFFHPRGLPVPAAPDYVKQVAELAIEILQARKGRAFFLFTSHRALRESADLLVDRLDYPLLVQGTRPKSILIDEFKAHGNAVLLGTASFWEGVDVRGDALSCVIIDKLPFASPRDPVMRARLDNLQSRGQNPFNNFQLPMAAISLKQGVGRLIRDISDRGVFVLCDPRLLKRSYGQVFLDSLPAMKRTRNLEDVRSFFACEAEVTTQ